ncbi:MAG: hypothetical protein INR65_10675, partial [Gluconacetobacter diazotrophicus]|nr:hypothetical protein [Gluconacetobacter diazotrophicus]
MPTVFDGKVLLAHHNPGDTPYLLVTFIGLYREDVADSVYLMKELVERAGLACVGITTRVRNFYLHEEMDAIAGLVRDIRQPGQKIIVVGQSSAGFAAAKFATLLQADYVLAFSPIFSAHAADLGLDEGTERESGFLKAAVRIHRIEPDV